MSYGVSDSDDGFEYDADDTDWDDTDWNDTEPDECTTPCPSCGAEIYDDAERCPVCGDYVTRVSGGHWEGRPLWWMILGLVGIAATIAALTAL